MYTQHYTAMKTLIQSYSIGKTPSVDWYNRQYERLEEVTAKGMPMVYVEFQQPVKWMKTSKTQQRATTKLLLHYVNVHLKDSPERFLAEVEGLVDYVQDKALPSDSEPLSGTLELLSTNLKEFSQLKVCVISFNCTLYRFLEKGQRVKVEPKIDVDFGSREI